MKNLFPFGEYEEYHSELTVVQVKQNLFLGSSRSKDVDLKIKIMKGLKFKYLINLEKVLE